MFIAVLFEIAKRWKEHKCPQIDEWIKKNVCTYSGILFSLKKEENGDTCYYNRDEL